MKRRWGASIGCISELPSAGYRRCSVALRHIKTRGLRAPSMMEGERVPLVIGTHPRFVSRNLQVRILPGAHQSPCFLGDKCNSCCTRVDNGFLSGKVKEIENTRLLYSARRWFM